MDTKRRTKRSGKAAISEQNIKWMVEYPMHAVLEHMVQADMDRAATHKRQCRNTSREVPVPQGGGTRVEAEETEFKITRILAACQVAGQESVVVTQSEGLHFPHILKPHIVMEGEANGPREQASEHQARGQMEDRRSPKRSAAAPASEGEATASGQEELLPLHITCGRVGVGE